MNQPLNRQQVKDRLGCSESMFWKLVRSGKLQGFYVGTVLRFMPEEVERYIEDGRRKYTDKYGPHTRSLGG